MVIVPWDLKTILLHSGSMHSYQLGLIRGVKHLWLIFAKERSIKKSVVPCIHDILKRTFSSYEGEQFSGDF